MIRISSLLWAMALASALNSPATAQYRCDAPTANAWLKPAPGPEDGLVIDKTLVRPIIHDLAKAITLLQASAFVPLSTKDLMRFTGAGAGKPPKGTRAYLVRAVFPTSNPLLSLQWQGAKLLVRADGLGCLPFEKHPIVVFLDRPPIEVFVTASAAL